MSSARSAAGNIRASRPACTADGFSTRASRAGRSRATTGDADAKRIARRTPSEYATSAEFQQAFAQQVVDKPRRVVADRLDRSVVLLGNARSDVLGRVLPVAELPDPCANVRQREVAAAPGVEQYGRIADVGEEDVIRTNQPSAHAPNYQLKRVRWRSRPSRWSLGFV